MTIKKRLFRSNILMIVLPIFLALAVSIIFILAFEAIGGYDGRINNHDRYVGINKKDAEQYLKNGNYTEAGNVKLYLSDSGKNVLVFEDDDQVPAVLGYNREHHRYLVLGMLILLVAIVYIINRTLTRYIFKSIMLPITTLTTGVHEIRDGNLDYQIEYAGKDEFTQVCNDFNEMAGRLQDMVRREQKDEQNRRELIAGISHDLRTPLTSIKAYVEGIEKGVAITPEKQKKYIDIIKKKTGELEYTINQLFLFSKLDIGEFPLNMTDVKIGDEINAIIMEYRNEKKNEGFRVSYDDQSDGAYCNVDKVQLKNVIINILGNSIKYKDKEIIECQVECINQENEIDIILCDNGPGVSKEGLERIFDVFYRGDAARRKPEMGSGLGLAISAKMVERFGGQIYADNNPDGGLKITIKLPRRMS